MKEYKLNLKISPSDTEFKKLIGAEEYNRIKLETLKKDNFSCRGCGFHPLDENNAAKSLTLHVESINEEDPKNSPCATLCMACHSTQHVDVALTKEWIQLINSTFSQKRLIETCRINGHKSLSHDNTRFLKTPPLEFLEKMKNGTLSPNSKAKALFTDKFEWGDL